MKRIFQFIAFLLILISIGTFVYRKYTKSFSPFTSVSYSSKQANIKVSYSSPAKKGRHIFGRIEDGALVPYGKVWRTGANEATVITFNQDMMFGGEKITAGSYSLWSIPGQAQWQVLLNSETGQWGTEYNDGKNILSTTVDLRIQRNIQEQFKIYFEDLPNGVHMILSWDQMEVIVPIVFF
jgi:hypothetical protein